MAFYQRLNPRLFALSGLLAALFLVLLGGLAWQQLWKAPDYRRQEQKQTLRRIIEPGPRGSILDRDGNVLVENKPGYSVVLYVDEMHKQFNDEYTKLLADAETKDNHLQAPEKKQLAEQARANVAQRYLDQANQLLGLQVQLDPKALETHIAQAPLLPFTLISGISPEQFARFNEIVQVEEPMQTRIEAQRYYRYGSLAYHTLGYVGPTPTTTSEDDDWPLDTLDWTKHSYSFESMIGRDGLEKKFDDVLAGTAGGEIWVVDPSNSRVQRVAQKTPQRGQDLQTSLDLSLQQVTEAQLHKVPGTLGSAVALDVQTGEVLAIASTPDFDLNETVPAITQAFLDEKKNTDMGEYNRATQVSYPPGSTFKVVTSIAGLRAGKLDANTTYDCPGSIMVGDHLFRDKDYSDGLGRIGLVVALTKSSDVFFYQAGLDIGHEAIHDEAIQLGFGQATGIEIPEAPPSRLVVPDNAWRKAHHMTPWNDGDTCNMAIGQGDLLVTPLQMACFAASLARNETRTKPTLLHNPNAPIQKSEPLGLSPDQRALLLQGMEDAASVGTAAVIHQSVPNVEVAAKTGTAQWTKNGQHLTVAWLMCFAPINHPRIAIAMAIESPDPEDLYYGGPACGPYMAAILKDYFSRHPVDGSDQN